MEEFLIGVLVGGLLFGKSSRRGVDVASSLRAYLNRKRYERFEKKAADRGFEREFQEQWRMHCDCMPFELQTGIESIRAFRRAEAISKQGTA